MRVKIDVPFPENSFIINDVDSFEVDDMGYLTIFSKTGDIRDVFAIFSPPRWTAVYQAPVESV